MIFSIYRSESFCCFLRGVGVGDAVGDAVGVGDGVLVGCVRLDDGDLVVLVVVGDLGDVHDDGGFLSGGDDLSGLLLDGFVFCSVQTELFPLSLFFSSFFFFSFRKEF